MKTLFSIICASLLCGAFSFAQTNLTTSQETLNPGIDATDIFRVSKLTDTDPVDVWETFKVEFGGLRTWLNAQTLPLGSRTITGTLPVANGGTGAATEALARAALGITGRVDIQTFTADGTWNKPAGMLFAHVVIVSGGGGGGSGGQNDVGGYIGGGGGGGSGGIARIYMAASRLSSMEAVVVGQGGPGGSAQATINTAGIIGTIGGTSSFAGFSVGGGGPGAAGPLGSGNSAGGSAGRMTIDGSSTMTAVQGTSGGTCVGAGNGSAAALSLGAMPASGGGGGGITSANVVGTGGAANYTGWTNSGTGNNFNPGAPAAAGAGQDGTVAAAGYFWPCGGGGGGGSANAAATGGNGATGGNYGGGGGGGGASRNGFSSGRGGDGGPGIVVIVSYLSP